MNVSFSISTDVDIPINSYLWDFGDDTTSTEGNPTHIYEDDRQYTVQVMITDNKGRAITDTIDVLVKQSFSFGKLSIIGRYYNETISELEFFLIPDIKYYCCTNVENLSIELDFLNEHFYLTYNEFEKIIEHDEDESLSQNPPIINDNDAIRIKINLTNYNANIPPSTRVTGKFGSSTLGVIDNLLNFTTPANAEGGYELT